jgi:Ca2+-binding RTX toxin-like protein
VVELAGQGIDSVKSALNTYTLGSNLENLYFDGTGDFIGTGNELDNLIFGGLGNDTLSGGAGDDALIGGAGNDTFVFGAGFGNDQIIDFSSGHDKIEVRNGLFADGNAALAAAAQVGNDILITANASASLWVKNFNLANLRASDFVIPPAASGGDGSGGPADGGNGPGGPAGSDISRDSSLAQLVQAMSSYSAGSAISDPMSSTPVSGDQLQNTIATSMH